MAKASTFTRALKLGDTGQDVTRAQQQLNTRGWTLDVDGVFGPMMLHAVNVFKTHHGMPDDGVLGRNAWAVLFGEATAAVVTERVNPNVVFRLDVVCQSTRHGIIDGIVLHDTEGANIKGIADLQGLGNYFNRRAVEASAHVGVDAEGQSARYVADSRKAWHCFEHYNELKLGIEQIGFASQTVWPEAQLEETARWCALWCDLYDLPVLHSIDRGICMHSDLGAAGGGHHDCGNNYPFGHVLDLTAHYLALRKA